MKKRIFFIWFCLCAYLFAANPICSNSEQDEIYRTKCYSFGDEFVYIYQEWPEYDNGDVALNRNLEKIEEANKVY
ncbi:hypothetical protein, partial [uncultured Fibrobacter sp.]|uniref:hypothetical protein n=1 Tax=uncultured Fibrobacter sp. TaxID=261512 RepID=UPI0025945363